MSALLPAGFPLLVSSVLGLPPLTADSFDPELPAFGVLVQGAGGEPSWVLAVHALSGPELVAKLCTGDHAPFRAVAGNVAGLTSLQASSAPASAPPKPGRALGVFDNYLLVADGADALSSAGPYAARMLPKRPLAHASVALRFSKQALSAQVVPTLRGLWAGYRTNLSHLDQSARSAHGGRAPDFGDPAQVILGADAVVESLLSLLDDATTLELDLEPAPESARADAAAPARRRLGKREQDRRARRWHGAAAFDFACRNTARARSLAHAWGSRSGGQSCWRRLGASARRAHLRAERATTARRPGRLGARARRREQLRLLSRQRARGVFDHGHG